MNTIHDTSSILSTKGEYVRLVQAYAAVEGIRLPLSTLKVLLDIAGHATLAQAVLSEQGKGQLPGKLGYIRCSTAGARTARNPRTGEVLQVPAKKVVKARLSKSAKLFPRRVG